MCNFGKSNPEEEIEYDYNFLSTPLQEKSKWNKHKGKYTKDFIFYVDTEYKKLQQKKSELESELVDTDWEIERIEEGLWWMV